MKRPFFFTFTDQQLSLIAVFVFLQNTADTLTHLSSFSITCSSHLLGFFLSSPMLFILSYRPLPDLPPCWSCLIAVPLIIPSSFWQAFHEENAVLLDLKGLRDLATLFSAVSGALVPAGAILQQLRLKRTAGRRHLPGEPSRKVRCLNLK